MIKTSNTGKAGGFTLVELLIVLAILGVIATFTIPKVLQSQTDAKRKAVFREAIAAMNEAFYAGYRSGTLTETNVGTYMRTHLNAIKICNSDAIAEGCWPPSSDPAAQGGEAGVILPNGAMIAGLDNASGGTGADVMILDWNGLEGPNQEGQDEIILRAFLNNTSSTDRVGTIRHDAGHPGSRLLWAEIFN